MNETVVVARSTATAWVPDVVAAARALGCRCVLVSGPLNEHARGFLEPLVDRVVEIPDPYDHRALAEAARTSGANVAAVVTSEDGLIVPAAAAAGLLGVGRCPVRALEVARNKYLTRCALEKAGEPGPRFALMHDPADAAGVAGEVGLPAVLKPINGAGSHLVQVVRTVADLARAHTYACERAGGSALAPLYARPVEGPDDAELDPSRSFLVESLVPGHEYSLELVIRAGEIEHVGLADKAILDERFFECGFVSPPIDLDPAVEQRVRDTADAAVRAIGLDNTVAHVEVRDDEQSGGCLIEINAGRPAGQGLARIIRMNTGVDLLAELVATACGLPSTRSDPEVPMRLASVSKHTPRSGRLVELRGLDEVELLPDVLAAVPSVRVGDRLTDEMESFVVDVVVAGFADLADLTQTYEQATGAIDLVIEPSTVGETASR